jgi:hypothetical protein
LQLGFQRSNIILKPSKLTEGLQWTSNTIISSQKQNMNRKSPIKIKFDRYPSTSIDTEAFCPYSAPAASTASALLLTPRDLSSLGRPCENVQKGVCINVKGLNTLA